MRQMFGMYEGVVQTVCVSNSSTCTLFVIIIFIRVLLASESSPIFNFQRIQFLRARMSKMQSYKERLEERQGIVVSRVIGFQCRIMLCDVSR